MTHWTFSDPVEIALTHYGWKSRKGSYLWGMWRRPPVPYKGRARGRVKRSR